MNIELVRLTGEYKELLFEMLAEWKNDIMINHTDMSPWKSGQTITGILIIIEKTLTQQTKVAAGSRIRLCSASIRTGIFS